MLCDACGKCIGGSCDGGSCFDLCYSCYKASSSVASSKPTVLRRLVDSVKKWFE